MNWTTEKPQVAGWYWWRGHADSYPKVVEIHEVAGRAYYPTSVLNDRGRVLGEWAGPIPVPTGDSTP